MIHESKRRQALLAIQAVMIGGRTMAYSKADHNDIARVLDIGEYLVSLFIESQRSNRGISRELGRARERL
jgi:hypothetical protein